MTDDPRLTPFDGAVAHAGLQGRVAAARFTEGTWTEVTARVLPVFRAPGGALDREALLGEPFCVISETDAGDGMAYGFLGRDGYCGYVARAALGVPRRATHRVVVRETFCRRAPELKPFELTPALFFGSRLVVTGQAGDWAEIERMGASGPRETWYVPACHLAPVSEMAESPVAVARLYLGTPYRWGGNSGRGIDCSGLVQAAMHACSWACPGDSDLQEKMPGTRLAAESPLQAGDLIFWKSHVAMATGPETMIHSNAYHMRVVEEPIGPAIARIAAGETGPVTSRLRPERRPLPSSF